MKITAKTTKEQLVQFLGVNAKAVAKKDKDLSSRLAYASKMMETDEKKVTKKDLVDLAREVMKLLGTKISEPAFAEEPPKAENSVKKLQKGVSKKQKSMAENGSEEVEESEKIAEESQEESAEEEVDKKSAKKSSGSKKSKTKKDGVTALEGSENPKTVQLAKMFPQTLEVGDNKYEMARDIETFEDLYNALADDQEIIFAYYWTKRHLRQFPYFDGFLPAPKQFDNDLDLATCIYVSDEKLVSYQVSMYTEAIYMTRPEEIKEEDGLRIARGVEYQIYRAV